MEKNLKVKTKAKVGKTSFKVDEELDEPVSPTSKYFLSDIATLYILSIFELEIPIDSSCIYAFFDGVFLDSHPRFSCIPIEGKKGRKYWKKVEVNVEDHIIKAPTLQEGLSRESYSKHLGDYMSKIATSKFQLNKPLWEVHIFNYPTNNATSTLIVKFHHAIADGISLMGVVFTCLRRVDDPTLPLTFPSKTRTSSRGKQNSIHNVMETLRIVPRFLSSIVTSIYDYGQILRVVLFEDECTPIRSGKTNMLLPCSARVCSVTLSLNDVKRIKSLLRVTVNDVVIGIISFATRLYIQETNQGRSNNNRRMTVSIALNTRSIKGYANPEEMRKAKTWGNKISAIELSLPKYKEEDLRNPQKFVMKVHKTMKRKRRSIGAIYLAAWTLDVIRIFGGFKAAARTFEKSWKNSTFGITNLIGPVQHISIADHPIKGFYFVPTRVNLSLTVSVMSYMDNLRIGLVVENGFIDHQRLIKCVENASHLIFQAATSTKSSTQ